MFAKFAASKSHIAARGCHAMRATEKVKPHVRNLNKGAMRWYTCRFPVRAVAISDSVLLDDDVVVARGLPADGKFNLMELQSVRVTISDAVSKLHSAYLCAPREELNPQILFVYAALTNIFGIRPVARGFEWNDFYRAGLLFDPKTARSFHGEIYFRCARKKEESYSMR